jgi:protein-histidine pros-kinase
MDIDHQGTTGSEAVRDAHPLAAHSNELLQSMPDGIVIVNSDGHIVFSNTRAETLFGYPKGGLHGKAIENLLPERYRVAH